MKIIVQRVKKAIVTKAGSNRICGQIDDGLLVLLGIKDGDTNEDADKLVQKLVKLRIMADENGKMNRSAIDTKSSILVVSQFTLYANTKDGNRPSFVKAMKPEEAHLLYQYFVSCLKDLGVLVSTGCFGEYMKIENILDGPVTIVLET